MGPVAHNGYAPPDAAQDLAVRGSHDVIGSRIGRYEVLQKVGEGGMATVYRARHSTLERDVALKVLHPHLSSSARNRERFAREARAIEHLSHPNILEIHDYSGADAADCWIVTEFVDGVTLTDLLSRCRRVPSEVASLIGIALADALAYAHEAGVLHRDLKPDNVMLRRDGTVKLMDFGIARFLDESQVTMTGALVGSPAFMSPEQAREDPLDGRSDRFSLGTLLFLLVTGELPFAGSNPSIILRNIIEGNRPAVSELAPDVSSCLTDVIERLMSLNPDHRYAHAREVSTALRGCLDEVGFDPAERRWSLARYLDDPDAYERDLAAFLSLRLHERARDALDQGDHLVGLRLINRLLEIDPEHEPALALVQTLHGGPTDATTTRARRASAVAVAILLAFTGAAIAAMWSFDQPDDPGSDATEPAMASDAPMVAEPPAPEEPAEPPPATPPTEEPPPAVAPPADRPSIAAPLAKATVRARRIVPRRPREDPRVVPAPAPDATPTPDAPACVGFRTTDGWSDVYLDGVRIRSTRDRGCHMLPPGTYTFALRSPFFEEEQVTVTLAAGEERTGADAVLVTLRRRPARVRFPASLDEDCLVFVDRAPRGTIAALGGEVSLQDPGRPHTIDVRCGETTLRQSWPALPQPDVTFDGRPVP